MNLSTLIRLPRRAPKIERELVYWHNAPVRRRLASIPVSEARKLPNEARYAHDNAPKRISALLWSTMIAAGFGVITGLLVVFGTSGFVLTSNDLVIIATITTSCGLLGLLIGYRVVYPAILIKPRYMVRANKVDGDWRYEALKLDTQEDKLWQLYLKDLRDQLADALEDKGENPKQAETLIPHPVLAGTPVARYDAYSMVGIEDCRAEKLVSQGYDPNSKNRGAIMKMAGGMIIAIGGVIVLALLLNDARSKEVVDVASMAVTLW